MKILSNKKYRELVLKSCRGMFGAVTDDMLLRSNAALSKEIDELKSRIEKAVEYINGTTFFGLRSGKTFMSKYLNELLNILNGRSDE